MYTGPNITTDGLVLYLDAANPKSYVSGSTVWRDLVSNQISGSLINGPTFDSSNNGSIVFDGSDDYVNFGNVFNNPNYVTVNFWVKNPNNNVIIGKSYLLWEVRFNGNEFGGYVGVNNGTNYWYGIADSNNILHGADLTSWNFFTYIFDYVNQNIKLYTNGALKGSINVLNMWSSYPTTYNLEVGRRSGGNANLSGTLSQFQMYNRALSAEEILQNYNATKSRFNL